MQPSLWSPKHLSGVLLPYVGLQWALVCHLPGMGCLRKTQASLPDPANTEGETEAGHPSTRFQLGASPKSSPPRCCASTMNPLLLANKTTSLLPFSARWLFMALLQQALGSFLGQAGMD